MKYLKKLLFSLKEIIITYILQYILIIISCLLIKIITKKNISYIINNYIPYIMIIFTLFLTIYLYKKNKRTEPKIITTYIIPYISIGISISCLLNMLIFKYLIITPTHSTINILVLIISSGLIGPIYEEILFRYILLNKLKNFNNPKLAILINSLIFALIHFNIPKIIYAFLLGLIINITYHKRKNILYPIIIHSSANITAIFLNNYNHNILLLSLICLIINFYIIIKKQKKHL